ncbi:MAG: sulfotransferase [Alphaproteobacteria bacterium]
MSAAPRPNFFVVGSMKSGTTSLHRYLVRHPQIFMTENPKEPTYFLEREQLLDVLPGVEKLGFWRGEQNYLDLFAGAGDCPVIGEASANYARLNRVQGVPERVADFSPDARILFIARDPVERTISHYWYMVRFFEERRDMLSAIREEPDYTETSDYAMQLKAWLARFPEQRVKFITTEALRDRPEATMSDVFAWLGVDADFVPPNLAERANEAPEVLQQVRGKGLLHRFRHSGLWNAVGPLVPQGLRQSARRLSEKPVERVAVDRTEAVDYLRTIQRQQADELAALLGRRFPEWTTLDGGT